jgi:hypothetical protein
MPLDKTHPALHLNLLDSAFYTLQYPLSTPIPPTTFASPVYTTLSITRNTEEISIIVSVPPKIPLKEIQGMGKPNEIEGPWGCIMVTGPMELSKPS